MSDLRMIGVSFKTAPLAVRAPLVLEPSMVQAVLRAVRSTLPEGEAVVLSTCNRTELYVIGASDEALEAWHVGVLGVVGADTTCPALAGARVHLRGRAAARHLFRVAAGLESALLGDNEVVGQLRAAVRVADDLGTLGPRLRRLADHALRTSKEVRSTTSIGAGGAGIGSAVTSAIADRCPTGRVLLVGAGSAAEAIAREADKRLAVQLVVANRSLDRGRVLADRYGATAVALTDLVPALASADAVVLATGSSEPILTPALVQLVRSSAPGWNPLVVDAGVPRNVAPGCAVEVVTLDSLAERTARVVRLRTTAVVAVERGISAGLCRWDQGEASRRHRDRLDLAEELVVPAELAATEEYLCVPSS